jgi:hypothetical protein
LANSYFFLALLHNKQGYIYILLLQSPNQQQENSLLDRPDLPKTKGEKKKKRWPSHS